MGMMDALLPGLAAVEDLHPLVVHFPIALWSAALLFWVLALRGRDELWYAGRWVLYLGSLTALVAVGTGLWAEDRLGHDTPGHELVHVHRNFMIAATVLGGATALLARAMRRRGGAWIRAGLLAALLLTTVVCALGADRGALLVYGHGVGTRAEGRASAAPEAAAGAAGAGGAPGRRAPGEPGAGGEHGEHAH